MEQAIIKTGRRAGWSETENKLLWETADAAQQQGLPLKGVFEQIARETGRRPNSIRNYYYAQVRERGDVNHSARFVPFTQDQVDWLIRQVLIARAAGQSVRSCLQKLSGGDHSLMLRYQNKYRAVIKSRPDYVRDIVDQLNDEGVACDTPHVNHRARCDLNESCDALNDEARRAGDADLARACDLITRRLRERRADVQIAQLCDAVEQLIAPMKDFLALEDDRRAAAAEDFCIRIADRIGNVEAQLPRSAGS